MNTNTGNWQAWGKKTTHKKPNGWQCPTCQKGTKTPNMTCRIPLRTINRWPLLIMSRGDRQQNISYATSLKQLWKGYAIKENHSWLTMRHNRTPWSYLPTIAIGWPMGFQQLGSAPSHSHSRSVVKYLIFRHHHLHILTNNECHLYLPSTIYNRKLRTEKVPSFKHNFYIGWHSYTLSK